MLWCLNSIYYSLLMTERELIKSLKNGDEKAFREFVEQKQTHLLRLCMGFVHNREDARDLVQEIFIEVFRSVRNFREDSNISTWLYRIAVNKSLNYLRKNRTRLTTSEDYSSSEKVISNEINTMSETPDALVEVNQRKILIKKAIDSLQKNQRIAFVMSKYEDLSYQEISDIMDISKAAVESLIHRAKVNLQKKLYTLYQKNLL